MGEVKLKRNNIFMFIKCFQSIRYKVHAINLEIQNERLTIGELT